MTRPVLTIAVGISLLLGCGGGSGPTDDPAEGTHRINVCGKDCGNYLNRCIQADGVKGQQIGITFSAVRCDAQHGWWVTTPGGFCSPPDCTTSDYGYDCNLTVTCPAR